MGKLVTIVGNSGTGKTTLAKALSAAGGFHLLLEENVRRPFQKKFDVDLKTFALANQIDFLLFRAEQEIYTRDHDVIALQDGGLDQDFHLFTKRFHQNGYLNDEEFILCERLYELLRTVLTGPDLMIKLNAPTAILAGRLSKRQRAIDIAKEQDLQALDDLMHEWFARQEPRKVIEVDTSIDEAKYPGLVERLVGEIKLNLN